MKYYKQMAEGRWFELTLVEQMAHIGSEVIRALSWKRKKDERYAQISLERALELLDLTISDSRHIKRLKEICRVREVLCDYFLGNNEYGSTDRLWENYFFVFAYAAKNTAEVKRFT